MKALCWTSASLIAGSWLAFMASFLLPATNVLQASGTAAGTPLTGSQAFTSSLLFGLLNPWAWFEPRVFLFAIFPFANMLMLIAPALVGPMREAAGMLAIPLVLCAIVPWFLPHTLTGNLFIGFYWWNLSFISMAIGCALASLAFVATDELELKRLLQEGQQSDLWAD